MRRASTVGSRTGRSAGLPSSTDTMLILWLSFSAGFVEAVCFVGLYRTFAAFITGTLMFLVVELLQGSAGYRLKLVVGAGFFVLTVVWTLLIRILERRRCRLRSILFALEAFFVAGFMTVGMLAEPLTGPEAPATLAVGVLAVTVGSMHSAILPDARSPAAHAVDDRQPDQGGRSGGRRLRRRRTRRPVDRGCQGTGPSS